MTQPKVLFVLKAGLKRAVDESFHAHLQITEKDEAVLEHLVDITCDELEGDGEAGFRLTFHFRENPFFTNTTLVCSAAVSLVYAHAHAPAHACNLLTSAQTSCMLATVAEYIMRCSWQT